MADILDLVDVQELRNEVQKKYREVAEKPGGTYHFHTVRKYAIRLGYDRAILDQLPNEACEGLAACLAMLWFAGLQTTPAKGSPGTHDVSSPRPFAGAHSLKNRRLRQQSQTAVKRVRRRKSGSLKYRISADSEYEYRMVDLSSPE